MGLTQHELKIRALNVQKTRLWFVVDLFLYKKRIESRQPTSFKAWTDQQPQQHEHVLLLLPLETAHRHLLGPGHRRSLPQKG